MSRERIDHSRIVYVLPPDFPERLEQLQKESGLPWSEIARRLGTYPLTIRRWLAGMRPKLRHQMALLELADDLGLSHILTAWSIQQGMPGSDGNGCSSKKVIKPTAPPRCRSVKGKARKSVKRLRARA